MSPIIDQETIASALVVRRSQSRAGRRVRISQALVRSTIHRLGSTTNPFWPSLRLTACRTSASAAGQCPARLPVQPPSARTSSSR